MKEIMTFIKHGKYKHVLRGIINNGKVVSMHYDGEMVTVPEKKENETQDERKARAKAETQKEHFEKILLNEFRIKEESK